jgi:hypothetical protein
MILTHGECERSSIVLGELVGVDDTRKKGKSSGDGEYFTWLSPSGLDLSEAPNQARLPGLNPQRSRDVTTLTHLGPDLDSHGR